MGRPSNGEWTPAQKKILAVLADGEMHSLSEVLACLEDSQASLNGLANHVHRMRDKLRLKGQDIVCQRLGRRSYYRQIRLLVNPNDGYQ